MVAQNCRSVYFLGQPVAGFALGCGIHKYCSGPAHWRRYEFYRQPSGSAQPLCPAWWVVVVLIFVLTRSTVSEPSYHGQPERTCRKNCQNTLVAHWYCYPYFAVLGYWQTVLFEGLGLVPGTLPTLALLSFIACFVFMRLKMQGYAFASIALPLCLAPL
jgi:hypothetical protein